MLELQNLTYAPATAASAVLRDVSFVARVGQPVLISGASGSGKTSLLDMISGLSRERSGQVIWNGDPLTPRQRRWITGMVFQFPERHFLGLTVAQELRLGLRRLSTEAQDNVLQRVGLAGINRSTPPERLSGGQQRRLAIAVQLLRGANVLLLDEPTAGLDWSVRDEVLKLLAELARDQVLIVVTHEPELFKQWDCQRHQLQNGELMPMSTLP
ncbi:MAG: ABC transporter ATP-binding protein [Synechococcus sp.]